MAGPKASEFDIPNSGPKASEFAFDTFDEEEDLPPVGTPGQYVPNIQQPESGIDLSGADYADETGMAADAGQPMESDQLDQSGLKAPEEMTEFPTPSGPVSVPSKYVPIERPGRMFIPDRPRPEAGSTPEENELAAFRERYRQFNVAGRAYMRWLTDFGVPLGEIGLGYLKSRFTNFPDMSDQERRKELSEAIAQELEATQKAAAEDPETFYGTQAGAAALDLLLVLRSGFRSGFKSPTIRRFLENPRGKEAGTKVLNESGEVLEMTSKLPEPLDTAYEVGMARTYHMGDNEAAQRAVAHGIVNEVDRVRGFKENYLIGLESRVEKRLANEEQKVSTIFKQDRTPIVQKHAKAPVSLQSTLNSVRNSLVRNGVLRKNKVKIKVNELVDRYGSYFGMEPKLRANPKATVSLDLWELDQNAIKNADPASDLSKMLGVFKDLGGEEALNLIEHNRGGIVLPSTVDDALRVLDRLSDGAKFSESARKSPIQRDFVDSWGQLRHSIVGSISKVDPKDGRIFHDATRMYSEGRALTDEARDALTIQRPVKGESRMGAQKKMQETIRESPTLGASERAERLEKIRVDKLLKRMETKLGPEFPNEVRKIRTIHEELDYLDELPRTPDEVIRTVNAATPGQFKEILDRLEGTERILRSGLSRDKSTREILESMASSDPRAEKFVEGLSGPSGKEIAARRAEALAAADLPGRIRQIKLLSTNLKAMWAAKELLTPVLNVTLAARPGISAPVSGAIHGLIRIAKSPVKAAKAAYGRAHLATGRPIVQKAYNVAKNLDSAVEVAALSNFPPTSVDDIARNVTSYKAYGRKLADSFRSNMYTTAFFMTHLPRDIQRDVIQYGASNPRIAKKLYRFFESSAGISAAARVAVRMTKGEYNEVPEAITNPVTDTVKSTFEGIKHGTQRFLGTDNLYPPMEGPDNVKQE